MHEVKVSRCKGCGREIVFAKLRKDDGTWRTMPLDYGSQCYELQADGTCRVAFQTFVTHFQTCPRANDFSSRNKEATHVGGLQP